MVVGSAQSAPIGDFVEAAAALDAPQEPKLKEPSEFKLIGNASVRRLDSAIKGNGTAMFAMDMHLPNQMVAMIARPEQRGAVATGFDDVDAKDVKGYIMSAILPNKAGVAVYAEDTWAAMQAREALSVEWDVGSAEMRGSEEIKAEIMGTLDADPTYNVNKTEYAETAAAH